MIQPADEADPPSLYPVGCVGEIVGVEELDNGRYNIILHGSNRFRMIGEADRGLKQMMEQVNLSRLSHGVRAAASSPSRTATNCADSGGR